MSERPYGAHIIGVVIGAGRHAAAGVEGGFHGQAVMGELPGVDLHQAEVDGSALREQDSHPRCGLSRRRGVECGGGQAAGVICVDADHQRIATTLMDGNGGKARLELSAFRRAAAARIRGERQKGRKGQGARAHAAIRRVQVMIGMEAVQTSTLARSCIVTL